MSNRLVVMCVCVFVCGCTSVGSISQRVALSLDARVETVASVRNEWNGEASVAIDEDGTVATYWSYVFILQHVGLCFGAGSRVNNSGGANAAAVAMLEFPVGVHENAPYMVIGTSYESDGNDNRHEMLIGYRANF